MENKKKTLHMYNHSHKRTLDIYVTTLNVFAIYGLFQNGELKFEQGKENK